MTNKYDFELITDANVEIHKGWNEQGMPCAVGVINDSITHNFPVRSSTSLALRIATPEQIGKRLSGGSFFVVDGKVLDFKDGEYKGFTHDLNSIGELMDHIGVSFDRFGNMKMRSTFSNNHLSLKEFGAGGEFDYNLNYSWSPFRHTIEAEFEILRLACQNMHAAATSELSNKIPVYNHWQDHLKIAAAALNGNFVDLIEERIRAISNMRASVGQVEQIHGHILQRLEASPDDTNLVRLAEATMDSHYAEAYTVSALENKAIKHQLPSHLTGLDLYNISTEFNTYSEPTERSSELALNRFASKLLFSHTDKHLNRFAASGHVTPFANHRAAFFGEL